MASSLPNDGIRRVSISPTDTEPESDDMEPCADPLPMEIDERPGGLGSYEVRFPAETPVTPPAIGLSHAQWCEKIMNKPLPGDGYGRECFDTLPQFVVGDPSARFETHTPLTYETNGETGQPPWAEIFSHILKECAYLTAFHTVYVMVDTRNLKAHETAQDGLPHWPAAVAWWHSRVQLVGPQQEKTELLYFPATEETGLHRVHPTWAGTFVLAALVAIFPGINFILLDSDCLPITLFEAADLWKEGFLTRFPPGAGKGLPQKHPLHRKRDYVNRPDVVYTQHRVDADRQGQGVLLVTEPHSELNAGLVVVFSSTHPSIFNWGEWTRRCRRLPDTEFNSLLASASEKVVQEFMKLLTGFLHRTLSSQDLTPQEKQQWVQSGLALSPLVATCTQYSVDFCLAWALIGEWTSRILFPVPKAPWPRHGHAGALLRRYQARSPRMVAWARATFEQGALPSLLFLQGLVPIFTLPGDKMFQATGLSSHKQRPPIMHAYGGAKSGMAQALQSIASEGWIPLAAAMVVTSGKQPLWADLGLRPVVGTTLDIKLGPRPLQHRDVALLLSCWKRWDFKSVADSAINTWLKGANTECGPDCEDSPCYRIRNMDVLDAMRLFGECGFDFLPETDLQKRPGLEVVMTVGLHLCALEMTDQQVDTLACIALAGQLPEFFPLMQWISAVKKSFLSQEVVTCATRAQWNEVCTMLQAVNTTEISLRSKNGTTLWTRASPRLPIPVDDEFPLQVLTPPLTRDHAQMPEVINIEATGLGGKDLRVVGPWDISIRTDPEGQNVYGPSLATVEDVVIEPCQSGGTSTKHVTSLGMSKATHEFLTLHYFALDSAEWWERILGELLPNAHFPDAVIRRNFAYKMFMAAHIAPSHRRPPHPVWEDSLCLIADLLFGNGVDRYVGAMQGPDSPLEVNVRGFSAGSYSGLAFLHILWSIPRVTTKGFLGAIACPPSLLNMSRAKKEDLLHLIHFESDSLCSWKPGPQQIRDCCTSFTYVTNEIASYNGHFGPDEHDYSHWMALNLPNGSITLRVLLFIRPEAASKARRDATPLRLISWLSYKLNPELEQFIEQAMEHLSTWKETEGGKVLTMGKDAIQQGETINSEVELRDRLIDLVSVGNLKHCLPCSDNF